jgi:Tol biopolymer transport system component
MGRSDIWRTRRVLKTKKSDEQPTSTIAKSDALPANGKVAAPGNGANILTSPDYEWAKPVNLGHTVNGAHNENQFALSEDGQILVFSSDRNGTSDLFECRRTSATLPFGEAAAIKKLSSPDYEADPCLSDDGLALLFAYRREGTDLNIWQSSRRDRNAPWDPPERLGPPINTSDNEACPALSHDRLSLVFSSNRSGGQGNYDLWRSRRKSVSASWEPPENLGRGVNSALGEFQPRFSFDDRMILFKRDNKLWMAVPDVSGVLTAQPLELPASGKLGSPVLMKDGSTLYFTCDSADGRGGFDIWKICRVPKAK